ncbi:MAG: hypothetical protein Q6L68_08165 [Thermostichus sp. DG02_5_bins_236]
MESNLDLALDYRAYRLAAVLCENLPLGELRGISLMWQNNASSPDQRQSGVSRLSMQQIEQRYLNPR